MNLEIQFQRAETGTRNPEPGDLKSSWCRFSRTGLQNGFTLVEVTLAMGVAAFSLIAVFGLLPIGITSNQTSIQQTASASLATAILSDLRATQVSVPAASPSKQFQIPIPASGGSTQSCVIFLGQDGSPSGTVNTNAVASQNPVYRATISFSPPAAGQRAATQVRIFISWPALADKNAASNPVNYSGSYEILSSLDRN
jgi:Tfp pilus assembly protein PilV